MNMYVTTFFSYKGGVGRTMALINTAYLLAHEGKRVLIVDFDLEAPGIPSFEAFRSAGNRPGIVDYVCAFRDSGEAPDVSNYILECPIGDDRSLWLMPAGRHTQPGYGDKLYSIDWKDLYDNHAGFLMFEDMRQQWAQHAAQFDYVLIDSRTGYTDVGGICTRQLPDAVVIMFLPNEQNIEGLKPMVDAIRREPADVREGSIFLHFCPSNVPDLDDEDHILFDKMGSAREKLGYKTAASVIHHYNSMDLLAQPAFAASRPNSKLANQYRTLMRSIVEQNYGDESGAMLALEKLPRRFERAWQNSDEADLREIEIAVAQIAERHPENGRIGWLLSILYGRMGAVEDELEALTLAIEQHHERNRAIVRRARVLSVLDRKPEAVRDLRELLASGTATSFEILSSIDVLRALDPEGWARPIQLAIDQVQANPDTYAALMHALMSERDKLPLAVHLGDRARAIVDADGKDHAPFLQTQMILALIGLGRFQQAMRTIAEDETKLLEHGRVQDIFNYAIASWGASGKPPVSLFNHVLARMDESILRRDANLYQCRALAEMVTGRWEAAEASLDAARLRARTGILVFSCWRYLEVSGRVMNADLRAMREAIRTDPLMPPAFFGEVRELFE